MWLHSTLGGKCGLCNWVTIGWMPTHQTHPILIFESSGCKQFLGTYFRPSLDIKTVTIWHGFVDLLAGRLPGALLRPHRLSGHVVHDVSRLELRRLKHQLHLEDLETIYIYNYINFTRNYISIQYDILHLITHIFPFFFVWLFPPQPPRWHTENGTFKKDLALRQKQKAAEFVWRASKSLGAASQVFTGLTGGTGTGRGSIFDVGRTRRHFDWNIGEVVAAEALKLWRWFLYVTSLYIIKVNSCSRRSRSIISGSWNTAQAGRPSITKNRKSLKHTWLPFLFSHSVSMFFFHIFFQEQTSKNCLELPTTLCKHTTPSSNWSQLRRS